MQSRALHPLLCQQASQPTQHNTTTLKTMLNTLKAPKKFMNICKAQNKGTLPPSRLLLTHKNTLEILEYLQGMK